MDSIEQISRAKEKNRSLVTCAALLLGMVTLTPDSAYGARVITAVDDIGRTVTLEQPATRIVSLAPHITENLFAAGIGDRVIGAVAYSDYPAAARQDSDGGRV